jgi:hypothetical protein
VANLPSPPVKDSNTSFSLFNWLRKLFNWAKPISEVIEIDESTNPSSIYVSGPITFTHNAYFAGTKTYYTGGDIYVSIGSLEFGGINQRILGDFSNANLINRLMFQSNVTDGQTSVSFIPNGTSTGSTINLFNNSDPLNGSFTQLVCNSLESRMLAGANGTGSYKSLNFYTSNIKQVEIDTAGKVTFTNNAYVGSNVIYHAGNKQPDLLVYDTRSTTTTPETTPYAQVHFDFKQNSTESLSDGGSFFGEMSFRPYGNNTDWSGGKAYQLGFTDKGNLWMRSGTSTTWGFWKQLNSNAHYVEDYGAIGDGTTDDTTAIQAAITAALASTNGSNTVIFKAKTYRITTGLSADLSNSKSIRIQGEASKGRKDGSVSDSSGTIIKADFASSIYAALSVFNSATTIGTESARCHYDISDLVFEYVGSSTTNYGIVIGGNGIQLDGDNNSVMRNVCVSGFIMSNY